MLDNGNGYVSDSNWHVDYNEIHRIVYCNRVNDYCLWCQDREVCDVKKDDDNAKDLVLV